MTNTRTSKFRRVPQSLIQSRAVAAKRFIATCTVILPLCTPFSTSAQVTLGGLLEGLKNSLVNSQNQSPDHPSSNSGAPTALPDQLSITSALPKYTKLIQELEARGDLRSHQWGRTYLLNREHVQEYTVSSIPGMYSLRNVRPDNPEEAKKWAQASGLLFEWQPIVFFTADGSGFYVRKENFGKDSDNWIVYDKNAGGYKTGEATRPYIQQMLTTMETTGLPSVGTDKPTFILYTSPSCPYSLKVDSQLAKSGMSYRVFPTYTINIKEDLPEVHRIFCSSDKLAAWKKALQNKARAVKTPNDNGNWWCSPTVMPVLPLRDLDFIFGQGYSTPSYYFPDGTVISGANNIDAVKAKSKEMAAKGLYFR